MIKKIDVKAARVGMYVSQLDRSWLETPFLSHKFPLTNPKQLAQVKESCSFIYIDTEKGLDISSADQSQKSTLKAPLETKPEPPPSKPIKKSISPPGPEDFRRAGEVHDQARQVISTLLEDLRMGRSIETTEAKKSVESLLDSLIHDNNALLCLTKLKSQDDYTVTHSINVSILALAFGRHLELSRERLSLLGLGALLHDIGKMKVPLNILNKPGKLTDPEFEIMKKHVLFSGELLDETKNFPPGAKEAVLQHHEKINGKGYPLGLMGNQIGQFGNMLSIVDVYDAITTKRVYKEAIPPHEAIKLIYEWSLKEFDRNMVEQFIKTVGIFPMGSQIQINHSDIGLVVSANLENALRPTVLLLFDGEGKKYKPPRLIDLEEKDLFTEKTKWSVTKIFGPLAKEHLDDLLGK